MALEVYFTFVFATILLIVTPGPSVILVVSHAMNKGFHNSVFTILGEATSHALFISITTLGLAPILMASATVFFWVKWIGVAYLIWLGIRQWFLSPEKERTSDISGKTSIWSSFLQGFTINTTNPKALVFYAAFFPPFLNSSTPIVPQLFILGITFLMIFLIISLIYGIIAARTRSLITQPKHIKLQNRITGGLLIGAGVVLTTIKNE